MRLPWKTGALAMSDIVLKFAQLYNKSKNLPVAVKDSNHTDRIKMHSHDFYEFVYVKGGFTVHYFGERATVLSEGDMFAVSPGVRHAYAELHYTNVINCMFSPEIEKICPPSLKSLPGINLLFDRKEPGYIRLRPDMSERMQVVSLIERLRDEIKNGGVGGELMINSLITEFFTLFSRLCLNRRLSGEGENGCFGYVIKTLSYIEENYERDIDLGAMAEHVGVSPDYLSRQFRRTVGIGPIAFLRGCRLARAAELMGGGESLADIARRVGYRYLSHFSRDFKKLTGMPPLEFKRKYAEVAGR